MGWITMLLICAVVGLAFAAMTVITLLEILESGRR